MAEWIGRRRSGPGEAAPETPPENIELSPAPLAPPAPGAFASPQMPGEVPDRSSVPGHHALAVPPATRPIRRPLTEYGTAQRIMHMYRAAPGEEMNPKRFESLPVSDEEARKFDPDLGRPVRPLPGYMLGRGAGAASLEAFEASEAAEAAALPGPASPAPAALAPSAATTGTNAQAIQPSSAAAAGPTPASAPAAAPMAPAAAPPSAASSAQPSSAATSPAARPAGIAAPNVAAGEQAAPPAVAAESVAAQRAEAVPGGQGRAAALAAAATRRGAVRGSGSYDCPASHPVKGNAQSGIYHTPESASYKRTIPEFCFRAAADAESAGFRAPR
jgi:hypothetical protein